MAKQTILKQLESEKFGGKPTLWRQAWWGDVSVKCAEDARTWYYMHRVDTAIIVQAKKGDSTPHCFNCKSKIQFKKQSVSTWLDEFDGPVGDGSVKTKHIPYCPKCEDVPSSSEITISR